MQATFVQDGHAIDYTPGAAVDSGAVVMFGVQPMIALRAIAASALGALKAQGVWDVVKDTSTIVLGDPIYWHTAGSPVGGTASSGAANNVASGGYLMGQATAAAATGVATVRVKMLENVNILRGAYPNAVYGDVLSGGTPQKLHELSSTQNYRAGCPAIDDDLEMYRYGYMSGQHHAGFGSYNVGKVNISAAAPAQTGAGLGAIGSTIVRVACASGGFGADGVIAANELVGGRLVINNGGGAELIMQNRRIIANSAASGNVVEVTIDMPLTAAVPVSTSYLEVLLNPFAHLIGGLTAPNQKVSFLGLPVAAALNQWGWLKTRGLLWICPVASGAGAPGYTAGDRKAYFAANGSIVSGTTTVIEGGAQEAGYVVENSTDGAGPPIVHLQLE